MMVMVTFCDECSFAVEALGRLTGRPLCTTIASDATMKKNSRNIITSIMGMTMISASSTGRRRPIWTRLRIAIGCLSYSVHAPGQVVDQFRAVELHVLDDLLGEVGKIVVGNEAEDRQADAGRGRNQRLGDAAQHLRRVGKAALRGG